jgi:DHA1 family multidrug resistance protein-like MFS transporter
LPSLLFLPSDQWKRNQVAVTVSAAFIFAGFTMIMPFVPLYIQMLGVQSQAAAAIWAGVVLAVSPLVAALIGPFWGRIADRYGLKIMAIRISFALFLIWSLTGFAQNVYQLFSLRFLLGILGGFNAFSISLATQLAPKDKVGRVIGTLQAVQISSAAVGPFIGGVLAGWIGIRRTFLVTSFLCLLSLLLFIFIYKDQPLTSNKIMSSQKIKHRGGFREMLALPNFAILAALLFLVSTIDRSFSPLIPLFVAGLSPNPMRAARTAGIIISLASLAESFSAWYSGRRLSRVSPKRFLLLRLVCGATVCLGLGFADSILQLLSLRVLLALLAGGTLTVGYTLASEVIPESDRATAFSLLSSCALLGGAAGPLLGGLLMSVDTKLVFLADGLLYALLTLLISKNLRWSRGRRAIETVSPVTHM